jgi:hypothetical protein
MNFRRKCPNCNEHCLSIVQILQLILGQQKQQCSQCHKEFKLDVNGFPSNSTFWFIEAVMYFCLISISLHYKSWLVFSMGMMVTFSVEVLLLYFKPIVLVGKRDRIDKVI